MLINGAGLRPRELSAGGGPPFAIVGLSCPTCPRRGTGGGGEVEIRSLSLQRVSPGKFLAIHAALTVLDPLPCWGDPDGGRPEEGDKEGLTMKRLLVPLDESPLAETILPVAEEWAKEEEAEVILVRALPGPPSLAAADSELQGRAVGEAETYLKAVAERLERRGVKRARWGVWHEEPAAAIAQAGAEYGVEMVAMATHGRSGLSRLVLGSVAEAVIRAVQVPVLLMRGQSAWKPWATGKVLVPLDGSESAEAILPVVERLAGPRDLTIVLFNAVEPLASAALSEAPTRPDQLMALRRGDAERYLAKVAEALWGKGLRAECAVKFGKPAETIAAFAGREQADLIAMATHGRSGLGRLLLGSVAAGVLKGASVPVLLFRAGERVR